MLRRTVFQSALTATGLAVGLLIAAPHAAALEITAYDELCAKGRNSYVVNLILGTVPRLADEGRLDDAEKVQKLFGLGRYRQQATPPGYGQLERNIETARNLDKKNGPDVNRLHVEHALMLTLKQNGIGPPADIMEINKGYTGYRDACAERSPQ